MELNNEQKRFDILQILDEANSDVIGVSRTVFDMVNDWNEAQIIAELVYWTSPSKNSNTKLKVIHDGYRWLACTRADWWERRRLTTREVDRALVRLINKNLVVKHTYLYNGMTSLHVRLNIPEFTKQYINIAQKNYSDGDQIEASENELFDAMEFMGWDNQGGVTKVVTGYYQNGNSINSNIHSNLLITQSEKKVVYGKPKPTKTKKEKPVDEDLEQFNRYQKFVTKKAGQIQPGHLQYLEMFTKYTGITYFPNSYKDWTEAFDKWSEMGVIDEDVDKAVKTLKEKNYSITSPKSLINVLNGIVGDRKTKLPKQEYNPWK